MDKQPPQNPEFIGSNQYGFQPPQQGPPPSYAPPGQYPPTQGQIPSQQGQFPPQQGQYPPQQGQFPPQQGMAPGQPVLVAGATNVIVVGTPCPACRAGVLEPTFTCCGIFLGICCFPLGLLCCWFMREKVCTNCQAKY